MQSKVVVIKPKVTVVKCGVSMMAVTGQVWIAPGALHARPRTSTWPQWPVSKSMVIASSCVTHSLHKQQFACQDINKLHVQSMKTKNVKKKMKCLVLMDC